MTLVVLPGLDGSGRLVREFARIADAHVITYPQDRVLSYRELADHVAAHLPRGRCTLIAESFAGPLAVHVVSRSEVDVDCLAFCNSFVAPPLPRALRVLPLTTLARIQAPDWILSILLGGTDLRERRAAMGEAHARVLASRIRMALTEDVRAMLAATTLPVVDVRSHGDHFLPRKAARRKVLAARPDATTADAVGPHALLFARPEEAWEVLRSAILAARVRPKTRPEKSDERPRPA